MTNAGWKADWSRDGERHVGAVDRDVLAAAPAEDVPVKAFAAVLHPVVTAAARPAMRSTPKVAPGSSCWARTERPTSTSSACAAIGSGSASTVSTWACRSLSPLRAFPDVANSTFLHHAGIATVFSILARHRSVGVALAILVEAGLLLPLAHAEPASVVGIPAAVAAAIGGTVAVVLGPFEGALVAFAGAAVFGALGGWGTGELAALAVWPAIVTVAGVFARRVERQRQALGQLVAAREAERQRLALALHDGTAQMLAASLMALDEREQGTATASPRASNDTTRALIQETIESVRALAVDLRPKALDDFGLAPALERLATTFTERTKIAVDLDLRAGETRLPRETELTVYRLVQEVLAHIEGLGRGGTAHLTIRRQPTDVRVIIEHDRRDGAGETEPGWTSELAGLRERIRLAGGRLSARSTTASTSVRAELPLERA